MLLELKQHSNDIPKQDGNFKNTKKANIIVEMQIVKYNHVLIPKQWLCLDIK